MLIAEGVMWLKMEALAHGGLPEGRLEGGHDISTATLSCHVMALLTVAESPNEQHRKLAPL